MATASPGNVSDSFQSTEFLVRSSGKCLYLREYPRRTLHNCHCISEAFVAYRPARGWQPVCGRRRHGLFHLQRLCPAYLLPWFRSASYRRARNSALVFILGMREMQLWAVKERSKQGPRSPHPVDSKIPLAGTHPTCSGIMKVVGFEMHTSRDP
jgi:hypothetical protein